MRVDGNGEPLILVHGVGLDHTMWDPVMGDLTQHRMVVRYDLLGHGESHDPPGPRTVEDFVGQLLAVLVAMDVYSSDVAGISLGALIVAATAARHPDRVDRIALLNSVFERSGDEVDAARSRLGSVADDGMGAMIEPALNRWFTKAWQTEHPEAVQSVRSMLGRNDVEAYSKAYEVFVAGDPMMPGAASDIEAEALIMTGELDVGSTPAMTHALAQHVPRGTARVLESLHHMPPIEAPRTFAAALLEFFEPGVRP